MFLHLWLLAAYCVLFASPGYASPVIAGRDSTTPVSTPLPVVLAPAVHPDVNAKDLNHLKADNGAKLFYKEANKTADSSTITILTIPDTQYPLVQIENSAQIKSFACSDTSATIRFLSQAAFQLAADSWSGKKFVIVSYHSRCGVSKRGQQRVYLLVSSIAIDARIQTITAQITHVSFTDAIGSNSIVTAAFGTFVAGSLKKRGALYPRYDKSNSFDFNKFATSTPTLWGGGVQLYHNNALTVACVGCGVSGHITISGHVSWSLFKGITAASVDTTGNLHSVIQIGVDATGSTATIPLPSLNIITVPLSPFSIPGIINIGPQISAKATGSVAIHAAGRLFAGATLNWPAIKATLNFKGSGATASGFTPTVDKVATVSGTVSAAVNVGVPISIGIGISVLNGKINKQLALVDTPGVMVTGTASTVGTCKGVALTADLSNNVNVDVVGLATIKLASFSTNLFKKCLSRP